MANIYEATKSDEEFIASDDEAGEQEAETFASLLQDEEDAREVARAPGPGEAEGLRGAGGGREKPVKPRKAPAPRIDPPVHQEQQSAEAGENDERLSVAGPLVAPTATVPSWVVKCAKARARVRKRAKVSEEVPR